MIWHDIRDPEDPKLDELAKQYNLHPLHIEDCRHRNQNVKLEVQNGYLFLVLKGVSLSDEMEMSASDLDFFLGSDFLITVRESAVACLTTALDEGRRVGERFTRPDQLLHWVADNVVDSYFPILDRISDRMDQIEEQVLKCPEQKLLEEIFGLKRTLIELRRVLAGTRDAVSQLLRNDYGVISRDMIPFFRDIYDHVIRLLDTLEVYRDLLASTTELYLTGVANQTNQVMKALTVFGAVATPALVITGIYGMNLHHLPFAESPHSWGIVISLIASVSLAVLLLLRKLRWL